LKKQPNLKFFFCVCSVFVTSYFLAFKQKSSMKKLRWGILSTAKIGVEKVIPAMQSSQYCDIFAIASRNLEKAQAAANRLGIPQAFGSYEELLASKDIDAVYIPLPNHLHVPWSIKALKAGKHVLCEKPIGLSVAEAQELIMQAQKYPRRRVMVKWTLRKYGYPPDKQRKATDTVIQQAEMLAGEF
jgi:predicted dehydrogenase